MAKVARLDGDVCVGASGDDLVEFRRKDPGNIPNHVLLLTIINPYYPIDVTVVHSICKPFGNVVRVVIFRKNGVQAMVEFDEIETAVKAKRDLDEKDIYLGCCRLKVEFAKPTKLNVLRNNSETWDYSKEPVQNDVAATQSSVAAAAAAAAQSSVAADTQSFVAAAAQSDVTAAAAAATAVAGQNYLLPYPNPEVVKTATEVQTFGVEAVKNPDAGQIVAYQPVEMYEPVLIKSYEEYEYCSDYGCVVMAYNLDVEQMNPDGLFNLFCMYGNVWKVKFLKSKKGTAMVQMGDRQGAERCLMYLQGLPLFGDVLQLGISKQPFLGDMGRGFELPDGSISWKDFSSSKNNRFLTAEMANKNRLNSPSKVLHFFNMPPNLTEERLEMFILTHAHVGLVDLTVFPNKFDRSSSGLMEFGSVEDAVACVVNCNNVPMLASDNSGPPYFIKLCFSSVSSIAVAEREYEKRNPTKYEKNNATSTS